MKKLIIVITVLIATNSLYAKTWRVNNTDPTADFSSLDLAMAGITAGDTLYLEGSSVVYTLSNAITKSITIIGPGYFLNENPNTLQYQEPAIIRGVGAGTVKVYADNCVFEGLTFTKGTATTYLDIGANNFTLRRCHLSSVRIDINDGISTNNDYYNLVIMQCYLENGAALTAYDKIYNALVCNNIITGSYNISGFYNSVIENNTIIIYSMNTGGKISGNNGCSIKNNIVSQTDATIGTDNSNCNVGNNYRILYSGDFINSTNVSTDGRFQLSTTSPAMTAGSNSSQCGAFGGSSPYVLSGLPSVPHIYEIDAPTSASQSSGLPVTIKIGTEK